MTYRGVFVIIKMMKEYECKGCGTVVFVPSDTNKIPRCPKCRSGMLLIGNSKSPKVPEKFKCPECGAVFHMGKESGLPYKCPFCNYTFSITPGLKQKERL